MHEASEPPSNEVLLDVLDSTVGEGEPFATLVAVSAIASTSADANGEFSDKLLDYINDCGALADPSADSIDATSNAIGQVLQQGNGSGAPFPAIVEKAAGLALDVALAAKTLVGGLPVDSIPRT